MFKTSTYLHSIQSTPRPVVAIPNSHDTSGNLKVIKFYRGPVIEGSGYCLMEG